MRSLEIVPDGWPCSLSECRPGLFLFDDILCVKISHTESFTATGEIFSGGAFSKSEIGKLIVQPVFTKWVITNPIEITSNINRQ